MDRLAAAQAKLRAKREAEAAAAGGGATKTQTNTNTQAQAPSITPSIVSSAVPPPSRPSVAGGGVPAAVNPALPAAGVGASKFGGPRPLGKPKPPIKSTATGNAASNGGAARPLVSSSSRSTHSSSSSITLPPLESSKSNATPAAAATVTNARPKHNTSSSSSANVKAPNPSMSIDLSPTPPPPPPSKATVPSTLKRKKTAGPAPIASSNVNWNPNQVPITNEFDHASKKVKLTGVSLADTSHLTKIGMGVRGASVSAAPAPREDAKTALWIQGVAKDASPRDLLPIFSLYGDVDGVELSEPTFYSRCGIVRFKSRDAAGVALEFLNGMIVAGRELAIHWFDARLHALDKHTPTDDAREKEFLPDSSFTPASSASALTPPTRNLFLHALHTYKSHITVQARAIRDATHAKSDAAQRREYTNLLSLPCATPPEQELGPPSDTQPPPRELIPYDVFEY